jgi:transcriptional regulator with XRE-family HTH domain
MTTDEIRTYFALKGVSQREVGRFIGVDARTIRSWFSGDKEPPQLFIMAIEADIFGVEEYLQERINKRLVLKKMSDMQQRIETLYALYEQASKQRDQVMENQRAMMMAHIKEMKK